MQRSTELSPDHLVTKNLDGEVFAGLCRPPPHYDTTLLPPPLSFSYLIAETACHWPTPRFTLLPVQQWGLQGSVRDGGHDDNTSESCRRVQQTKSDAIGKVTSSLSDGPNLPLALSVGRTWSSTDLASYVLLPPTHGPSGHGLLGGQGVQWRSSHTGSIRCARLACHHPFNVRYPHVPGPPRVRIRTNTRQRYKRHYDSSLAIITLSTHLPSTLIYNTSVQIIHGQRPPPFYHSSSSVVHPWLPRRSRSHGSYSSSLYFMTPS